MNYIKHLERESSDQQYQSSRRAERLQEFREHLASPKFNHVAQDGSRTDWISTADVSRWLRYIEDVAQNHL